MPIHQPCNCAATATTCGAAEISPAVCPICHGRRTERGGRRHPARCEHRYGPQTHLPVITTPIDKLWKERVATPRAWGNAVEKLRSRQTDLKQRGAAAKITAWTKAVEKVRSKQAALAKQAAGASRPQEP